MSYIILSFYSIYYSFFFFFSSRRRHTRCSRDWSSDVCSSDLGARGAVARPTRNAHPAGADEAAGVLLGPPGPARERARGLGDRLHAGAHGRQPRRGLREGLVAQTVPRRPRRRRAPGLRERVSIARGARVSATRGRDDAVSVPPAVHRGAMLSAVALTASARGGRVVRHLRRLPPAWGRSEEHTSELQSRLHLVCRLLLEKKKTQDNAATP